MDKYDLLEAMGQIRDEFIWEAADPSDLATGPGSLPGADVRKQGQIPAARRRGRGRARLRAARLSRWAAALAALLCLSIIIPNASPGAASAFRDLPVVGNYFRAVTFRAYEYSSATADAYVEEPALVSMAAGDMGEIPQEEAAPAAKEEAADASGTSSDASMQAALSSARISRDVRRMAEEEIAAFEESLEEETGFHALRFLHETVTDTADWYCLAVTAYTSSADGFEQVTHFTIDKKTGQIETLASCFGGGEAYVQVLSEEIKRQMRAQMEADPDLEYWLDSEEDPEFDFKEISSDQDFYFDEEGQLVVCFNESDVAPMYMGTVEFTIPKAVTDGLRH